MQDKLTQISSYLISYHITNSSALESYFVYASSDGSGEFGEHADLSEASLLDNVLRTKILCASLIILKKEYFTHYSRYY